MKKNLEYLRYEFERIDFTVVKNFEEFATVMKANIEACRKDLLDSIKEQKEENLSAQSQLTETRKDNSDIQEGILIGGKTVADLLNLVGGYEQD